MPPRRRGKATTSRAAAIQAVQRKRRAQLQQHDDDDEDDDNHHNHHHNHLHSSSNTRYSNHLNSKDNNHHHNLCHHHHQSHQSLHNNSNHNATTGKRILNKQLGKKRSHHDDEEEEEVDDDFSSNDDEDDDEDDDDDCPPPLVGNDEEFCDGDAGDVDDDDDDDDAVVGSTGGSSNTMSGEGGCLHCHKSATTSDIQVRCDECQAYICQTCHWCHEFQANHEIRVCDRCDAFYCRTCDEMDQCDDCGEVVCASCSTLLSCKFCGGGLCEECATACGRCGIVLCSRDAKFAVDCDTCRLSYCLVCLASGSKDPCVRCGHRPSKRMEQLSLLQAAASAASKHSNSGRPNASRHHHQYHHHASSHHASTSTKRTSATSTTSVSRDQQDKEMVDKYMVDKYMAEKEKADAAAAALLAELDEEEAHEKSKKNKKKRKKERQQAKKDEEVKKSSPEPDNRPSSSKKQPLDQTDNGQQPRDEDNYDDDSDVEIIDIAKPSAKKDNGKEGKKKKKKKSIASSSQEDVNNTKSAESSASATTNKDTTLSGGVAAAVSEAETLEVPPTDPIEQQLAECVVDSDMNGIEEILLSLKGVPGRAQLRKNAKKALKKLKAEQDAIDEAAAVKEAERLAKLQEEEDKRHAFTKVTSHQNRSNSGAGTPATHSETTGSTAAAASNRPPPPPPLPPNELYRVVSLTHNKPMHPTASSLRGSKTQQTANAATGIRSECILHIAYNVVGWVIGKGGQRIRDLMEESGAKVWIDQEHLSEKDPRIVFVSGNRKSVEIGVKLVKELVNKAPVPGAPPVGETELSHPSTGNILEVAMKNLTFGSPMKSPLSKELSLTKAIPGIDPPLSGSITRTLANGEHAHEISCEACFVPLLIGRRGWTIKHIQDSSGARVDIDQTVTPRKVRISGAKDNVQTAIRMVRDVLSYPHAQLQGAAESLEDLERNPPESLKPTPHILQSVEAAAETKVEPVLNILDTVAPAPEPPAKTAPVASAPVATIPIAPAPPTLAQPELNVATLSNTTTVGASNQAFGPTVSAANSPPKMVAHVTDERVHTPPPSSHINIGDAKSTISASSSLSSTPEPSMASSSKGHFGSSGTPGGPLIPPEYSGGYAQPQQTHQTAATGTHLFGQQQSNLPQMNLNTITDTHGGGGVPTTQHAAPHLFAAGMAGSSMPAVSPRYDMQTGIPRGFPQRPHQQQQRLPDNQQSMLMGQSILREQQQQQQHLPAAVRSMNGLGGMPHHGGHYRPRPDAHAYHGASSMQFPSTMQNPQRSLHVHQQSAFHASDQKQMRHNHAPDMGMGGRFHPSYDSGAGNVVDHRGKSGNYPTGGMWGSSRAAPFVPGADNSRVVRHSSGSEAYPHNPLPVPSRSTRSSSTAAALGGLGIGTLPPLDTKGIGKDMGQNNCVRSSSMNTGKDDSRMVDSLFGPTESGNDEKDVLPGFQGLALGDGLGSEMWSKNLTQDWDSDAKGSSALFAAIQPNLGSGTGAGAGANDSHPSRSRFLWGSESQGQSS
ncbi:Far upstream element-binding protein 1 [Seminavis robusta]|uniref:Far upstream element-binding protein 1 n=1 Tax=Seminavis robusta TaxID=568900 RepID=A0A9N8DBA1_9STRA|nr:Far upstream element-binding protein 1 [Seminavis robusta]|eukprot:Sro22_g015380.1 Far upstream element-binding protein 1 (1507) ;mRNA; r:89024-93821